MRPHVAPLASLALAAHAAAAGPACQFSTYELTPEPMTWTEANDYAVSVGGQLVAINSSEEQQQLIARFLAPPNDRDALWIGLTDEANEGTFVWTSGEPVTYTNWGIGEPNDAAVALCAPTGEDYVAMNWPFRHGLFGAILGQWNDTPDTGVNFGCTQFELYQGVIEFVAVPCNPTDLNCDGNADIDDVLIFLNAFSTGDPTADFAAPFGTLNIDDVLFFLNAFALGCP